MQYAATSKLIVGNTVTTLTWLLLRLNLRDLRDCLSSTPCILQCPGATHNPANHTQSYNPAMSEHSVAQVPLLAITLHCKRAFYSPKQLSLLCSTYEASDDS